MPGAAYGLPRSYRYPLVVVDYSRGIHRDGPLDTMPEGKVYDSMDFLLHQPGVAQKRGGTAYAGPAMTAATYALLTAWADFGEATTSQLVAIGDNGHFYKITAGTTTDVSTLGAGFFPSGTAVSRQKPIVRMGGTPLLVIPGNDGATIPKKYDGTTVANLAASAPTCKYGCVYKSRLVLGGTGTNLNRIFFSPTPDITAAWDTTNSWIDADHSITGMASLSNAIIVFSTGATERIIGSTPPPGSDMDRAPIGSIGCTDARSIVVIDNNAIFANPKGVFMTNGAGFSSLTREGGIESYWQSLLVGYERIGWTISAGVIRGAYYIVSILNGSTLVDTLVCNIATRSWWRMSNIKAMAFASTTDIAEELYYADRSTNRVTALSGIFLPTASNKNDANGTPVTPQLTTGGLGLASFLKHIGHARVGYDMRDAASDLPTLAVSIAPGMEATTFRTVPESPLAATTDFLRKRFRVDSVTQLLTVKFVQSNASSKTEIYGMDFDRRYLGLEPVV